MNNDPKANTAAFWLMWIVFIVTVYLRQYDGMNSVQLARSQGPETMKF